MRPISILAALLGAALSTGTSPGQCNSAHPTAMRSTIRRRRTSPVWAADRRAHRRQTQHEGVQLVAATMAAGEAINARAACQRVGTAFHIRRIIRRARTEADPHISEIRFAVKENILRDPSRVTYDMIPGSSEPGIWLWEEDGKVLGFSAADTRDGTIFALFIDPEHEGRGIGRALFAKALEALRKAGHRPARSPPSPAAAPTASIRRAGWKAIGTSERGERNFHGAALTALPLRCRRDRGGHCSDTVGGEMSAGSVSRSPIVRREGDLRPSSSAPCSCSAPSRSW